MSNTTEKTSKTEHNGSTNKFGEQNWDDVKISGDKEKTEFMRLQEGSNLVRILTLPYAYYQHRFEPKGGKQWGYRISCSDPVHKNCPLCEQGNKPVRKWFLGVIDRRTNSYKILDVGFTIFKGLQLLARDEDWGPSLDAMDCDLINNPSQGAQRYSVVCKPKRPLSASDLQIKEENGVEALIKRSTPPDRESVQGYMEHILDELRASGVEVDESSSDDGKSNDEGEDTFFKDYDKK